MAAEKLTLNLVTPEKPIVSNLPVDMVILPALKGEMGILPKHVQTIVQLGMGSLRYKEGEKEEELPEDIIRGRKEMIDYMYQGKDNNNDNDELQEKKW